VPNKTEGTRRYEKINKDIRSIDETINLVVQINKMEIRWMQEKVELLGSLFIHRTAFEPIDRIAKDARGSTAVPRSSPG
jgi:hypothetical protein